MKKRIFSLILTLALLCTLLPAAALTAHAEVVSGTCGAEGDGSNLTWTLNTDTGVLTISGSGAMADWDAFAWNPVFAPWFEYYNSINEILLPNGLTSIGNSAFYFCEELTSVSIPNSVTSIGDWAFCACSGLTSVTIPESLTSIGICPFDDCYALTGFTVADTNAYFSSDASGVLFNKDKTSLICYPTGKAGAYEIPDGVTSIDNYAFVGCMSLTSVTIPGSVKSIGRNAFSMCMSLTSVTIPDSVTSIGDSAFYRCSGLTSVAIPDSVTSIGQQAFSWCADLTSATIGNGVTSISPAVFEGCRLLTNVTIGNSVTTIDRYAFNDCEALPEVTIPDSVEFISTNAFARCFALTSVTIPDSVEHIGFKAFFDCPELTSVTIGKGIELIEESALGYYDDGDSSYATVDGFTIYGYTNTYAPKYAEYNGFTFISLGVAPIKFDDVAKDAYYADAVAWAVEHEVTNGTGDGMFSPAATCTRGQVVTFLWRAKGNPEPTKTDDPFVDVTGGYYYKAVLWAVEQGITSGLDATHFGPNEPCTRGQVVTFLWRTEGKPAPTSTDNPFADVTGGFYYDAVLWAVENKITAGMDATHFAPMGTCTRGQIVTFLYRDLG